MNKRKVGLVEVSELHNFDIFASPQNKKTSRNDEEMRRR